MVHLNSNKDENVCGEDEGENDSHFDENSQRDDESSNNIRFMDIINNKNEKNINNYEDFRYIIQLSFISFIINIFKE